MMRFMMYHKEYAPKGREFDSERDNTTQKNLSRQGWVDNPAKIGVNLWGVEAEEEVAKTKAKFERGQVPALDSKRPREPEEEAELERVKQENEKLQQRLADLQSEYTLGDKIRDTNEMEKDYTSDADKITDHRPDAQMQVPDSLDLQGGDTEAADL